MKGQFMNYNVCNVSSVSFGCKGNIRKVPEALKETYKGFRQDVKKIDEHALNSGVNRILAWTIVLPERLKHAVEKCFKK